MEGKVTLRFLKSAGISVFLQSILGFKSAGNRGDVGKMTVCKGNEDLGDILI